MLVPRVTSCVAPTTSDGVPSTQREPPLVAVVVMEIGEVLYVGRCGEPVVLVIRFSRWLDYSVGAIPMVY